jgi:hypothetical protein
MPPASRRLRTSGASAGATTLSKADTPLGVGMPATSTFSLMVKGTPCSGPRNSPRAAAASASRASRRASSKQG